MVCFLPVTEVILFMLLSLIVLRIRLRRVLLYGSLLMKAKLLVMLLRLVIQVLQLRVGSARIHAVTVESGYMVRVVVQERI